VAKRGFENSEEGYMMEKGCSLTLRPHELARPCNNDMERIPASSTIGDNSCDGEDAFYLPQD
jgi:hypothetical protein